MKRLFVFLLIGFLGVPTCFASGDASSPEKDLLQQVTAQVEQQLPSEQEAAKLPLGMRLLHAIGEGNMSVLESVKYNKGVATLLPELRTPQGDNVFHLAKDENVVQFIAFVLRNADPKTGGMEKIKELLDQKNNAGETPVFKQLSNGNAGVYVMYSSFIEMPKYLKKASTASGTERAEFLAKIQKHLQNNQGVSLLKAGELALAGESSEQDGPTRLLLKDEVAALSGYADTVFFDK